MKKIFFTTAVIALFFTSCTKEFVKHERVRPSGRIITEAYYLSENIHRVGVSDIIDLHLFLGDENHIEIHADDNILPHIAVRQISRSGLEIFLEGVSFIRRSPQITVYLTLRDLNELSLSGASSARLHLQSGQALISDRLSIRASGSSSVYFQPLGEIVANTLAIRLSGTSSFNGDNISVSTIDATLSGSSRLDLAGESTYFNLTSSGTNRTRAFDLICHHLDARLSGSSNAQVTVRETLRVTLSGASRLTYDGNPDILYQRVSTASSLQRR